jgi:hypothetical protein
LYSIHVYRQQINLQRICWKLLARKPRFAVDICCIGWRINLKGNYHEKRGYIWRRKLYALCLN